MEMSDSLSAMDEQLGQTMSQASYKLVELNKVLDFANIFGEWLRKEGDVILHLFPRGGKDDVWTEGHYIPRCLKCNTEIKAAPGHVQPCPRCGGTRLRYIPGRFETVSDLRFPDNMEAIIKVAMDRSWHGDYAVDKGTVIGRDSSDEEVVVNLGSYAVQIQGAGSLPDKTLFEMINKIYTELDVGVAKFK